MTSATDFPFDQKEAESLARFWVAKKLPRDQILAKIRADATVKDHVKQLAEGLMKDSVARP